MRNTPLEEVINSTRYTLTGFLGRGCWGSVYSAKDNETGKDVAIKIIDPTDTALRQIIERDIDIKDALIKEGAQAELKPTSNVVPRKFEKDKKGTNFIVMPKYDLFLNDVLDDDGQRRRLGQGITMEQILGFAKDLSNGISEFHTIHNSVHGDIKGDNLAIDEFCKLLLNDLGTSTLASYGLQSRSPRENMGEIKTRAPECFLKGSHPQKASDVWAFGSLFYRMLTGEYALETELALAPNPIEYMQQTTPSKLDGIMKKKIRKNIPKPIRNFLMHCLAANPYDRPRDGVELKKRFEESIQAYNHWKNHTFLKMAGCAAAGIGLILGLGSATVHSQKINTGLEEQVQSLNDDKQYEKRIRVLALHKKLFTKNAYIYQNVPDRDQIEFGEIDGWKELFGDIRLAYAAYLDADAVFAAIQKTGGKKDFELIEPVLKETSQIYAIANIDLGGYADMLSRAMYNERTNVSKKWAEAEKNYQTRTLSTSQVSDLSQSE